MPNTDTIAALATPRGRGGIAVIRVSGPLVAQIARTTLGRDPTPREAMYSAFYDTQRRRLDWGIALYFPGPKSFTGEDVLELHGHGGLVVVDMLLENVLAQGARMARPGEFSERGFLNGKIDLAQAESIADLIDSGSRQAAASALRSLEGVFSRQIRRLVAELIALRTFVEAAIDFPEEEIDFLSDSRVAERVRALEKTVQRLVASARQGCVLREGLHVVLAGKPNSGKSSLLNALLGTDRAIVSDVPGTTRDTIEQQIHIDGMPLFLIDTAGLRETRDAVESQGVDRTRTAVTRADHVLLVVDDTLTESWTDPAFAEKPCTLVINKIDLSGRKPGMCEADGRRAVAVSATRGDGLPALREHLKQVAGYEHLGEDTFIARRRHVDAITRAAGHIDLGRRHLCRSNAGELLAEELRLAQNALSEITGEFTSDDLLGEIFSSFCIGK